LTGQYAQIVIQRTRAELAAGLKKSPPHPQSSLRRTKRSSN
jgi:hypothetical protein